MVRILGLESPSSLARALGFVMIALPLSSKVHCHHAFYFQVAFVPSMFFASNSSTKIDLHLKIDLWVLPLVATIALCNALGAFVLL
jgi:hypothetical protein